MNFRSVSPPPETSRPTARPKRRLRGWRASRLKFCAAPGLTLLPGGATYFPALIARIDAAEDIVRLETYIFCHDDAGQHVSEALVRAAQRGVDVRVMTDGIGTARLSLFDSWPAAGIQHRIFNPHLFGAAGFARDHRKVCAVDLRVAFVGGINIVDDMMNDGRRLSSPRWDFAVEMLGPVVRDVALAFDAQWERVDPARQIPRPWPFGWLPRWPANWHPTRRAIRQQLQRDLALPPLDGERGSVGVRVGSGSDKDAGGRSAIGAGGSAESGAESGKGSRLGWRGDRRHRRQGGEGGGLANASPTGESQVAFVARDNRLNRRAIERAYLYAIGRAANSVVLANPYFTPGRRLRLALNAAARRGVDVRLLIGRKEFRLLDWAVPSLYGSMLRAGVKIAEYDKAMLHGKVAVVDEDWGTVGSSNLDALSLFLNHEANVVIVRDKINAALRASIVQAFDSSRRIDQNRYAARHWPERLLNWSAYSLYRVTMRLITVGRYD